VVTFLVLRERVGVGLGVRVVGSLLGINNKSHHLHKRPRNCEQLPCNDFPPINSSSKII
jgi:hypothetical protein